MSCLYALISDKCNAFLSKNLKNGIEMFKLFKIS